ncbi:hypothetical protein [Paenibacillus terrae]|nr:hypothetical protein [Paenibacillus terrae]
MKKLICSILFAALILVFPTHSFAEVSQSKEELSSNSSSVRQHGTITIPLEVTNNSVSDSVYSDFSTQATKIVYATVDFWVDVDGSTALGNWIITMDDKKNKIIHVNISLVWSNGQKDTFNYSTNGVPTYVTNQGETVYSSSGLHSAKLYGGVSVTGATGFNLPTNGAKVTFTTK